MEKTDKPGVGTYADLDCRTIPQAWRLLLDCEKDGEMLPTRGVIIVPEIKNAFPMMACTTLEGEDLLESKEKTFMMLGTIASATAAEVVIGAQNFHAIPEEYRGKVEVDQLLVAKFPGSKDSIRPLGILREIRLYKPTQRTRSLHHRLKPN